MSAKTNNFLTQDKTQRQHNICEKTNNHTDVWCFLLIRNGDRVESARRSTERELFSFHFYTFFLFVFAISRASYLSVPKTRKGNTVYLAKKRKSSRRNKHTHKWKWQNNFRLGGKTTAAATLHGPIHIAAGYKNIITVGACWYIPRPYRTPLGQRMCAGPFKRLWW